MQGVFSVLGKATGNVPEVKMQNIPRCTFYLTQHSIYQWSRSNNTNSTSNGIITEKFKIFSFRFLFLSLNYWVSKPLSPCNHVTNCIYF